MQRSPLTTPAHLDPTIEARLRALADRQDCVARRAQLLSIGITDSQIDRCLVVGRWRDLGAGIVVLHNGPLTQQQQWSVAVLGGGRLCALSSRSAATADGLAGWPAKRNEVLVPRGTTYPAIRGVLIKAHESRRFNASDIRSTIWPPRVRIERALVDGASWSDRPRTACGLLAAGVQQRFTVAERLLRELDNAGAIRFRRILKAALTDIAGGAQAVSEMDFLRFCARHGLPKPILQIVRVDSSGRRRYLDATLVGPDGRVVRVEIDGALHLLVRGYWDDMSRGNELVISGERTLRFPSVVLHLDEQAAADQLRRALGLSGPSARLSA